MMDAWRKLDALVGKRVMGVEPTRVDGDMQVFTVWRQILMAGDYFITTDEGTEELPHYSTDIAAAWRVVEHMRAHYDRQLEARPYSLKVSDGQYRVGIRDVHVELDYATAPTAPHAICLAALKAVEARER